MKQSFRNKIIFFLMGTIAITIFLCWFFTLAFLRRYFVSNKVSMMGEIFSKVNEEIGAVNGDVLSKEQKAKIDRIEASQNVKIYLLSDVELESPFGTMYFTYFVYPERVVIPHNEREEEGGLSVQMIENREYYRIYESSQEYLFPKIYEGAITRVQQLEASTDYMVMLQHNEAIDADFLDLYGKTSFGYDLFVRAGQESIEEAVRISTRFMLPLGLIVLALVALFSFFFSRRFTRPILSLATIAKKMAKLDFETKYEIRGNDEIAVLGNSINSLSRSLEKTITDLKQANIALQSDIDTKNQIEEARKEFLSNVTHELKTPIALIQGYAEGLKDNVHEDAENREFYCDVILDEAIKMNQLVKSLLSLDQLETKRNAPSLERFDLTELVRNLLASMKIIFTQKEIFVKEPNPIPVYVWADEYMIEEVLTNFISNAIHHVSINPFSEPLNTLCISVSIQTKKDKVLLSVFNSGDPIPTDELDKIWDKFYKIDKARTREYGGNGIGLSIVKAIMELHHERYGVSNVKGGVEFFIELDGGENLEKYKQNIV